MMNLVWWYSNAWKIRPLSIETRRYELFPSNPSIRIPRFLFSHTHGFFGDCNATELRKPKKLLRWMSKPSISRQWWQNSERTLMRCATVISQRCQSLSSESGKTKEIKPWIQIFSIHTCRDSDMKRVWTFLCTSDGDRQSSPKGLKLDGTIQSLSDTHLER